MELRNSTHNINYPWCVVTDPGTDREYVEATQHKTHAKALHWVKQAEKAGIPAQVMKWKNGELTTEF